MDNKLKHPGRRWTTILLVGLALSIGWGIRGNFGAEYGAAIAGCLAAIAVALLSGRADWRQRVLYFAFFGALGWGFGGSISYMQVVSYAESGHAISQLYGYFCLFYIGFLWAALGGAGTAFAAVAERERITKLFIPIIYVFGAWFLLDLIEDPIANLINSGVDFDSTWSRHENPLYWFDADYLPAFFALLGAGIYDLVNRREKNIAFLPAFIAGGALSGWFIQWLLRLAGWEKPLASLLTYPLGDPNYIDPATDQLAFDPNNFLNNWPQWFGDYPQHVGWFIGLIMGITLYFVFFGKFRNGASLIVYMAGGWIIVFLALPVLGSLFFLQYGGIHMTPPRSDDWAGITGVFIGMILWMRRNKLMPVAMASVVSGAIGGLGISGMIWFKELLMAPGNPRILEGKGILPGSERFVEITSMWANWQQQNWHSFFEQTYGFVNGIAIAVALGLLATRLPVKSEDLAHAKRRWTLGVAAFVALIGVPYVNLIKNVRDWSNYLNPEVWNRVIEHVDRTKETVPALWDFPLIGRLPGMDFIQFTPWWWYTLTWILLAVAAIILLSRHLRQPLSMVPKSWLGKGQIVFLILLWVMVIGNFERALVNWHPQRLLTEWIITVNAIIATIMVLVVPAEVETGMNIQTVESFHSLYKRAWRWTIMAILASSLFFLVTNRWIYHYPEYNKLNLKQYHSRFGPQASWRAEPNLKNHKHQ